VAQYDTPERILAEPAEEYVSDFVGAGAALKQLTLTRVADVPLEPVTTARVGADTASVIAAARAVGDEFVVVLDERGRPISWPSVAELARTATVPATVDDRLPVVALRATLNDALDAMLAASQGGVVVTGRRDAFAGVMAVETVMAAIQRTRGVTG
jgi:osmoprotectant transport system ATP-binding protein